MKIIIIGCGKVGFALAEGLTQENHDVTIIDSSAERLQDATEELDAMSIVGNGSSINTLERPAPLTRISSLLSPVPTS